MLICCVTLAFISSLLTDTPVHVNTVTAGYSFSDLLMGWGSALLDPATYTTLAHIDGLFTFLMNETFLSSLSSDAFGSLSRDSILGTIPNIFFVVCIVCVILSLAVAIIEIRKLEASKRVVKK